MRVIGTIPEEITIVSSVEQPVYRQWEGESLDQDEVDDDGETVKIDERREMIIPAFPIESGNKKTLKTAIQWAEQHRQWYDPETKKYLKKSDPVVQDARKNEPMTGIQVVALEHRGNGGRAYKVKTAEKYYFDMREDVMLDAMIKEGISPGGILNGKFIFGRVGSQMKLIRVGSELHKGLLAAVAANNSKKLDASTFQVGDVFEGKTGKQKVFCGWVSTATFTHTSKTKDPRGHSYGSYGFVDTFSYKPIPKAMLWLDTWGGFGSKDFETNIKEGIKNGYYCDVSTTHTLIKKLGTTDIIPPKIITSMASKKKAQLVSSLARKSGGRGYYKYEDPTGAEISEQDHDTMSQLSGDCKLALMIPYGTKFELDDDFKKYLKLVTK
jgi:hypothetical protein